MTVILGQLNRFLAPASFAMCFPIIACGNDETRHRIISAGLDGAKMGAVVGKNVIYAVSPLIAIALTQKHQWQLLPASIEAIVITSCFIFQSAYVGLTGGLLKGALQHVWNHP